MQRHKIVLMLLGRSERRMEKYQRTYLLRVPSFGVRHVVRKSDVAKTFCNGPCHPSSCLRRSWKGWLDDDLLQQSQAQPERDLDVMYGPNIYNLGAAGQEEQVGYCREVLSHPYRISNLALVVLPRFRFIFHRWGGLTHASCWISLLCRTEISIVFIFESFLIISEWPMTRDVLGQDRETEVIGTKSSQASLEVWPPSR